LKSVAEPSVDTAEPIEICFTIRYCLSEFNRIREEMIGPNHYKLRGGP
jgi:hypothetical protein